MISRTGQQTLLKNPSYNPMPEGAVSGMVQTPDDMELRFARWKATRSPVKGTVILLHGRSEYIERTYETVGELRERGFDVLTFDWRGQGGSSRVLHDKMRGYIDDFEDYVTDLDTIMKEVALPDCTGPFYIFAHSTGSLVALLAAPRIGTQVERMVLASPFLGIGKQPISAPMVKVLAQTLTVIGLGEMYLAGSSNPGVDQAFEGNIHTNDPERFKRNKQLLKDFPELAIGGPTAAWVYASCKAMEIVSDSDFCKTIAIPSLFVMSGDDSVVSNRASESVVRKLRSAKSLTIFGAKHELLQEKDIYREQLLAAFDAFVPGSAQTY